MQGLNHNHTPCHAVLPNHPLFSIISTWHRCLVLVRVCRERNDGLYTPLTYLSAKLAEEVTVALLLSLGVSCLVWFPLELAGSWALFWFTYFQTTVIGVGACTMRSNMPCCRPGSTVDHQW